MIASALAIGVQTDATIPNNLQTTYMQTVTCKIQQCCVRLHGALHSTVSIELWLYASPLYSKPCAHPFFFFLDAYGEY